jgi:hypothetical protein
VAKDVNPSVLHLGCPCHMVYVIANSLFSDHFPIGLAEHKRPSNVSSRLQRCGQPLGEWNVSKPPALGRLHMSLPHGRLRTELSIFQIDVSPRESRLEPG